jgi:GTP-binding protein
MKIQSAQFRTGAMTLEQIPADGRPHIAFAGRSNVGKSSLQNALLGRKGLVKVSGTPGKTREINFFLINEAFYFADLPGLGYAKFSKTKRAFLGQFITQYLETCNDLRAVIYLVDPRTGGTDTDKEALAFLKQMGIATLVVGTKRDKLSQSEMHHAIKNTMTNLELEIPPLLVSSQAKFGLDTLWEALNEAITA